jgi:oligoribonuclease NrnB/cAMP/cGMP phosphodiesterase (DHH superfamily)
MIGVYHNRDLDGFTSGAIIKLKYPDAKMIGYDYGQPFEQEVTGEPIIMADVSLYTTKDEVDCSIIAKSNGGGGHKKAAGFRVEDISKIFSQIRIA